MKAEANPFAKTSERTSQRRTSEDSQIKSMLNSHSSWGLVLTPICESSEQFSAEKLPGDEHSSLSRALSSGANCEARSLSETFASINKSSVTNSQRRSCKGTVLSKTVDRETCKYGLDNRTTEEERKSLICLKNFTLAVAIDILPCIIAVIWAAAIFFSMPSHAQ
uniref:Uncharacterized protein n=1 Tax=Cryptomonas curvata TaxID=233186 RepID=A0A7S0QE21_9CRYP